MFKHKVIYCLLIVIIFIFAVYFWPIRVLAEIKVEDCESKVGKNQLSLEDAKTCENYFAKLFSDTSSQKQSLQTEIAKFNAIISLTSTKIYSTGIDIQNLEKEITDLSNKISILDSSLDQVTALLINRVRETYKISQSNYLVMLLTSSDLGSFASRFEYLKTVQLHDRDLMFQMESVRTNFEDQKNLKEEKQTELEAAKKKLESQKVLLAQQKSDKENLLKITQNNEIKYQQLLAASRAEVDAIQRIIAGKGQETQAGDVNQGQNIASIIPTASACSTGAHLHFEVREGENVKNPFSYLKNISLTDYSGGDPHNGTGDWDWPLNGQVQFNQGYGSDTSAIRSHIVWYSFHTGIDIYSSDLSVKSVKKGTLYRGSISCGGGTLRYVRVDHQDSGIDSYYLHVNY